METRYNRRHTDRVTREMPVVTDTAVEVAARNLFAHEANDYVARSLAHLMSKTTLELPAIPDMDLCR